MYASSKEAYVHIKVAAMIIAVQKFCGNPSQLKMGAGDIKNPTYMLYILLCNLLQLAKTHIKLVEECLQMIIDGLWFH